MHISPREAFISVREVNFHTFNGFSFSLPHEAFSEGMWL